MPQISIDELVRRLDPVPPPEYDYVFSNGSRRISDPQAQPSIHAAPISTSRSISIAELVDGLDPLRDTVRLAYIFGGGRRKFYEHPTGRQVAPHVKLSADSTLVTADRTDFDASQTEYTEDQLDAIFGGW